MVETERFQAVKNFFSANAFKKEGQLMIHPVFLLELIEQTQEMQRLDKQIVKCRFAKQPKRHQIQERVVTPDAQENSDNSISSLLPKCKGAPAGMPSCDFMLLSLGKFVQIEDEFKESQINAVSLIASYIRKSDCGSSLVRDVSVLNQRKVQLQKPPLRRQATNESESEFLSWVERDKGRLTLTDSLFGEEGD